MLSTLKRTSVAALAVLAAVTLAACSSPAPAAEAESPSAQPSALPTVSETISLPSEALDWQDLPDGGGIQYANTRGDLLGTGPYEAFVTFPAGTDNPLHTHSDDLPTVILSGTFYAIIDGERTEFGPGSYYDLPADLTHFSGCTADADCLLFQYQSNGFDLLPTDS